MNQRRIPAFCCCYLLRSEARPTSMYVGSTMDPRRRLAQHNGTTKGGAKKTADPRGDVRPWEMLVLVSGFPSSTAALQFEWAWQNPNKTNKIPKESRPKSRPYAILPRLSSLHLLLRVDAFSRWPLTLRFFDAATYASWSALCSCTPHPLPSITRVLLDERLQEPAPAEKRRQFAANGVGGMQALDISHASYNAAVEKARGVLRGAQGYCDMCARRRDAAGMAVCAHDACRYTACVQCLAGHFIAQEKVKGPGGVVLPVGGMCPGCGEFRRWEEVARGVNLRTRMSEEPVAAEEAEDVDPDAELDLDFSQSEDPLVDPSGGKAEVHKDVEMEVMGISDAFESSMATEKERGEEEKGKEKPVPPASSAQPGDQRRPELQVAMTTTTTTTGAVFIAMEEEPEEEEPVPPPSPSRPRKQLPIVIPDSEGSEGSWDDAPLIT